MSEIDNITEILRRFRATRKFEKYHTPKNLTMALVKEASELMEIYQWQNPVTGEDFKSYGRNEIADECADVFIYLLNFCDVTGIDLLKATREKIKKNAAKYPVT